MLLSNVKLLDVTRDLFHLKREGQGEKVGKKRNFKNGRKRRLSADEKKISREKRIHPLPSILSVLPFA